MNASFPRVVVLVLVFAFAVLVPLAAIEREAVDGKPAFREGDGFGYYLWKDGSTWKVRWTTFGAVHVFTGRVHVEGGELEDFKRIDVDTERRIIRPGHPGHVVRGPRGRVVGVAPGRPPVVAERTEDHLVRTDPATISFRTRTDDDIDGFDFKVKGPADRLRFVLEIDGKGRPSNVWIGRNNAHPSDDPFVVPLR